MITAEANYNTVNPDNFNDTCRGYVIRTMREMKFDAKTRTKIMRELTWAFDVMTMTDARRELEKYRRGEINFD